MYALTLNLLHAKVRFLDKINLFIHENKKKIALGNVGEATQPLQYMTSVMRKPDFCLCENKDADQQRSNCAADQRLCFRFTYSSIPLLT